jgi:hypothetical protein
MRVVLLDGRSSEKYCVLCTYNPPAEEVGLLDGFLYDAAQNFDLLTEIQDQKSKPMAVDVLY